MISYTMYGSDMPPPARGGLNIVKTGVTGIHGV